MKRLNKEIVNERIAPRGIKLVGEYYGASTKAKFRCEKGHEWETTPGNIFTGTGCPKCCTKRRANAEVRIRGRLRERGIELLGEYKGSKLRCDFQCRHGHQWNALLPSVSIGTGCPTCAGVSDADAVYIWRLVDTTHNEKPVYKIGTTSVRLRDTRIREMAKFLHKKADIVIIAGVGRCARAIEKQILMFGENPGYTGFGGFTEFRALTNAELSVAVSLITYRLNQKIIVNKCN